MSEKRERAVRERAYAIWEQNGRPEGRSLAHWLQAEAEIGSEPLVPVMRASSPVKSRRASRVAKPVGESRSLH